MKLTDEWYSVPSENESGSTIIVTVRDGLNGFIAEKKFRYLVEVTWKYKGDSMGMPTDADAERMEQMEEAARRVLEGDQTAILAMIYTGADERVWEFYARSTAQFGERLNQALAKMEVFPITLSASIDEDWEEYQDACELKKYAVK